MGAPESRNGGEHLYTPRQNDSRFEMGSSSESELRQVVSF